MCVIKLKQKKLLCEKLYSKTSSQELIVLILMVKNKMYININK